MQALEARRRLRLGPAPQSAWISVTCPTSVVCTCACVEQQQQRKGSEHLGDTYSAVPGVAGCDPPPQTPKAVLSTRHAQAELGAPAFTRSAFWWRALMGGKPVTGLGPWLAVASDGAAALELLLNPAIGLKA